VFTDASPETETPPAVPRRNSIKRLPLSDVLGPISSLDDVSLQRLLSNLHRLSRLIADPPNVNMFPPDVANGILTELKEEYDQTRYTLSDMGMRGSKLFDTTVQPADGVQVGIDQVGKRLAHLKKLEECAQWVRERKKEAEVNETKYLVQLLDYRNGVVLSLTVAGL
jgi:hypothetical protein